MVKRGAKCMLVFLRDLRHLLLFMVIFPLCGFISSSIFFNFCPRFLRLRFTLQLLVSGSKEIEQMGSTVKRTAEERSETIRAFFCADTNEVIYYEFFSKLHTDEDLPNPPALKAAWKGSFEIRDSPGGFYDGFQAHHPLKISPNAYDFIKDMPGILQFSLRPRCSVWPKIFGKVPPDENDIALYFLPGDFCRSQQQYTSLEGWTGKDDLCLYSCIGNVEILIFNSRQLPVASHKMNQRFYLWGVFQYVPSENFMHGEQDVGRVEGIIYEGDAELVDMEINMIGGEDIGRIDKVISPTVERPVTDDDTQKGSREKSYVKLPAIPPGFYKQLEGGKKDLSSKVRVSEGRQPKPMATFQKGLEQCGSSLPKNPDDSDTSSLEKVKSDIHGISRHEIRPGQKAQN